MNHDGRNHGGLLTFSYTFWPNKYIILLSILLMVFQGGFGIGFLLWVLFFSHTRKVKLKIKILIK